MQGHEVAHERCSRLTNERTNYQRRRGRHNNGRRQACVSKLAPRKGPGKISVVHSHLHGKFTNCIFVLVPIGGRWLRRSIDPTIAG